MIKARWGKPAIFAVVLLTAIASGFWIWNDATLSEASYKQQTEQRAKANGEAARIHAEAACKRLPAPEIRECVHEEYHASRERDRQEHDLEAQLVTSAWTRAMGLAAVIGMVVGFIGVGLVYITFGETREANNIARDAQRAWIRLGMHPQQVSPYHKGMYFRVEFTAENIGETVATHFDFESDVFFKSPDEPAADLAERIYTRIEEWKAEYDMVKGSSLLPKDTEGESFWDDRQPPNLKWFVTQLHFEPVTHPVFVAAVFYRTATHPDLIQLTWRAWYLCTFHADGQRAGFVPRKDLGPKELCIDAFRKSAMHEEYPAGAEPSPREEKNA